MVVLADSPEMAKIRDVGLWVRINIILSVIPKLTLRMSCESKPHPLTFEDICDEVYANSQDDWFRGKKDSDTEHVKSPHLGALCHAHSF